MKKSNKIIALCLSFVLLFAAVGGTIAWLTDHASKENVFSVGKVDISLFEEVGVTDALGNDVTAEKVIETENGSQFINLLPGNKITKAPTIHNNGNNDAYVRVVVEVENKGDLVQIMNDAIDLVFEDKIGANTNAYNNFYNTIFDGWNISYLKTAETGNCMRFVMNQRADDEVLAIDSVRVMDDATPSSWQFATSNTFKTESETANKHYGIGYFPSEYGTTSYYQNIMTAGEGKLIYVFYLKLEPQDTYTLFNGFNVPESFDAQSLAFFDGLEVNVYADAIQTEGFADGDNAETDVTDTAWYKAFEALNEQHALGWWNN